MEEPPAPPRGPGIQVLAGRVVRLRREGFEVSPDGAGSILVTTMTDARRLALRIGDKVSVLGGMNGETFASGSIHVESANGASRRVEDAPSPHRGWFGWLNR